MQFERNKIPEHRGFDLEVPFEDWGAFLDTFNRQHEGWLVTIEISSPAAAQVAARGRRLVGVTVDRYRGTQSAYIDTGDDEGSQLTHAVTGAVRMVFLRTKSGGHRGLEIVSGDGTITRILFRSAALPEMLERLGAA